MTTTLRGITWEHARGFDCMVVASKFYSELVPEVDVRWEFRSLQAFADAPIEKLASEYDLLVIDHPHVPLAAESGAFATLDGVGFDDELAVLAGQSVGRSHESYAHEGRQWGLASDAAAQVALYRPDLLAEPPTDWDGVLELAREGRVLWPAKPIDSYSSLLTIAANNGTPAMAQAGTFLDADSAGWALDRMHELAALVPTQNLNENPIAVADTLSTSDRWSYTPLAFGYTNYSRQGFRPHRLRAIDIPRGRMDVSGSLLGGAGIAVSATASDLRAARAFAFWVSSAAIQSGVYFDGGGQPGNSAAWEDARLNVETDGFFASTRASLEGAYLRPRSPRYIDFQDRVSPLVTEALIGELTDAELIRRLNSAAEDLLSGP